MRDYFFGGAHRIEIENIRDIKTSQNYAYFMESMYYFHCIVNGTIVNVNKVSGKHKEIWLKLMDHNLGIKQNDYTKYVNDTFEAFVNYQTQIVLDLAQIWKKYIELQDVIFIGSSEINGRIFTLFRHMTELVINAYLPKKMRKKSCGLGSRFSLYHLLLSIEKCCRHDLKITIREEQQGRWLNQSYKSLQIYELHSRLPRFDMTYDELDKEHILMIDYRA